MGEIKKLLSITALFIMLPLSVYADCQSDFKAVEKEFKVSYKYNEDTDDYSVTFVNPYYERYYYINSTKEELDKAIKTISGNKLVETFNDYKKTEYHYAIVAFYDGCKDVKVKDETLKLVNYNPYADREECKGNEDFVLCQKDYDKVIDEETFNSRLESYLKSKESTSPLSSDNSNNSNDSKDSKKGIKDIINSIKNYIEENTVEVIIIAVFIVTLIVSIIIFINKSITFSLNFPFSRLTK